ncbi:MAG: hypothetical protein NXI31_02270 [bacterium]|nr:hypothetical protein [bacterium]
MPKPLVRWATKPLARIALPLVLSTTALAVLTPLATSQCATDWVPGDGYPGVHGNIYEAVWWDPDGAGPRGEILVVGGNYLRIFTVAAANLASWDPTTGEWAAWPPGPSNDVFSLAVMPNGDLVAGGWFTHIAGQRVTNIARFNGATWSPLGGGVTGPANAFVNAIVPLPNGDLIAAGKFDMAGGVPCNSIARWDGSSWSPLGAGINGTVQAAARAPNGDLFVGGNFFMAGALVVNSVARWDGSQWHTLGTGVGSGGVDRLLVEPNGDVLVGGGFTTAGGQAIGYLARWDGSGWSALGAGPGQRVRSLRPLTNGDLLAGTQAGAVMRWNGQAWSPLGGGLGTAPPTALAELSGGDVLALGYPFPPFRGAARWNGATWRSLPRGFDERIYTIGHDAAGDLVVGGHFLSYDNDPSTSFLARFDGAAWSGIGGGVRGPVHATAVLPNGDLVVAGDLSSAGGRAVQKIARWDGAAWHPMGSGFGFRVNDLAVLPNGDLVAAGAFVTSGSRSMRRVARWDGVDWRSMAGGMDAEVRDLTVMQNGHLLAGGYFSQAGGGFAPFVAVWDGTAWGLLGNNNGSWPAWEVDTVTQLRNGDVIVGGRFQSAGGVSCNNVARFDGANWSSVGPGVGYRAVTVQELPNGDLVLAGSWETIRWDGVQATPFATIGIQAMAMTKSGDLAVGGSFVVDHPNVSAYFGRIRTSCPADVRSLPTGCVGSTGPVELAAVGLPWVGADFTSRATGFTPGSIGVALLGLTSPDIPWTWLWPNTGPGCQQLASQEAILLTLPQGSAAGFSFTIPNDQAFVGLQLYHQFLHFEVDVNNHLGRLSASNALELVIGAF